MRNARLLVALGVTVASAAVTCVAVLLFAPRQPCAVELEWPGAPFDAMSVPSAGVAPASPAPPAPAFDALACATKLDKGAHARELERPSEPVERFVLHDAHELADAALVIATALHEAWHPHVELDAMGMATLVELQLPHGFLPSDGKSVVLDLVSTHPCLFGMLAPDAVTVTQPVPASADWMQLVIEAQPSIGAITAFVEARSGGLHVSIQRHLWPIRPHVVAVDPARLLARYLGRRVTTLSGERMIVDPKTHERLGCVPMRYERTLDQDSLRWRAGAVIECRGRVGEVRDGAVVRTSLWLTNTDPLSSALPAVLAPDGTPLANTLAPATTATERDEGECPVSGPGIRLVF
jgi:hypothetical protein